MRLRGEVERCYAHIGQVIREVRAHRGWTQQHVADLLGLTRSSICNLEQGRQRLMLHDLPRIARALDVRVHELIEPKWRA